MGACCTTRDANAYAKEEKEKAGLSKDLRDPLLDTISEQHEEPDSFERGDKSKQKGGQQKEHTKLKVVQLKTPDIDDSRNDEVKQVVVKRSSEEKSSASQSPDRKGDTESVNQFEFFCSII